MTVCMKAMHIFTVYICKHTHGLAWMCVEMLASALN